MEGGAFPVKPEVWEQDDPRRTGAPSAAAVAAAAEARITALAADGQRRDGGDSVLGQSQEQGLAGTGGNPEGKDGDDREVELLRGGNGGDGGGGEPAAASEGGGATGTAAEAEAERQKRRERRRILSLCVGLLMEEREAERESADQRAQLRLHRAAWEREQDEQMAFVRERMLAVSGANNELQALEQYRLKRCAYAAMSVGTAMETQQLNQRKLWGNKDKAQQCWWDECEGSRKFTPEEFLNHFRFTRETFQIVCDRVGSLIVRQSTRVRAPVPIQQRIALAIWRLASADPLYLVSRRFGLGVSTCQKTSLDLCTALNEVMLPDYVQWPVGDGLAAASAGFEEICGIPLVAGVLYTCHISISSPRSALAEYFNKRHTERFKRHSYSVTVQATVDHRGMFTDLCLGFPGSLTDEKILEKSALYQRANSGTLLPPGYFVVGARTYPLMDWLMVPYSDSENLTWAQRHFNDRIAAALAVGRRAFTRLKARWRFLTKRTESKIGDLPSIIGACCVLHNIAEKHGDPFDPSWGSEIFDDFVAATRLDTASPVAMAERDRITQLLFQSSQGGVGAGAGAGLGGVGGWGHRGGAEDDDVGFGGGLLG